MNLSVRVRKRLSSSFALDTDFVAAPGVTIVFGESGSGKTTLLSCVAGLIRPDEGRIVIGARTLLDTTAGVDIDPSRRHLGFVFQHLALFPHLSAAKNIEYGLAHLASSERHERTMRIAESFRIGHLLGAGGEISAASASVGLARSLVTDPEILLLDEPLTALDHGTQSRIMDDLRHWNAERRIPVLYVTHSQREALMLGERVLVVENGTIVADGTPSQVMEMPSRRSVAQLAGFENILEAVVISRHPEAGVMVTRLAGTHVDLETPIADVEAGCTIRVAVRAGDILIATEPPRGLSARNLLPGTIASLSREGAFVRAEIDVGVTIEAHVTPSAAETLALQAGHAVWLVIKTHSCHPLTAI